MTQLEVALGLTSGNERSLDTQERKSEREGEKSKGPETLVSYKDGAKSVISRKRLASDLWSWVISVLWIVSCQRSIPGFLPSPSGWALGLPFLPSGSNCHCC